MCWCVFVCLFYFILFICLFVCLLFIYLITIYILCNEVCIYLYIYLIYINLPTPLPPLSARSRRDDLISFGFTLLLMARGRLPWDDVSRRKDRDWILAQMESATARSLCVGLPRKYGGGGGEDRVYYVMIWYEYYCDDGSIVYSIYGTMQCVSITFILTPDSSHAPDRCLLQVLPTCVRIGIL